MRGVGGAIGLRGLDRTQTARLLANGRSVESRDVAALGDRGISEHDVTDDFVVVLHGVGEAQGQLVKVIRCRHRLDHASVLIR